MLYCQAPCPETSCTEFPPPNRSFTEGSAYGIVTDALRASARAADQRGPKTLLLDRFVQKLELSKPSDLIAAIYGGSWDRARLATLAPLVMEVTEQDDVAAAIIAHAAGEIALAVATVARQLGLTDRPLPLALTGGVVLSNPSYRARIVGALKSSGIEADPVTPVHEPAEGALRIALGGVPGTK